MTDKEALDELEKWMIDYDPTLDGDHPAWVWDLVDLIDDILLETGRS